METAKVFTNGRSQAIRLPQKYRFNERDVYIKKIGRMVLLISKSDLWKIFLSSLDKFPEDFFEEGRKQEAPQERETIE
ncbi:MAG: type II toxin-antitoxin system VapB family antitoxin [bacterium]|jgi:antitoxin VapB